MLHRGFGPAHPARLGSHSALRDLIPLSETPLGFCGSWALGSAAQGRFAVGGQLARICIYSTVTAMLRLGLSEPVVGPFCP
jgi:hypothetical protein